jgi:hypothetical protein
MKGVVERSDQGHLFVKFDGKELAHCLDKEWVSEATVETQENSGRVVTTFSRVKFPYTWLQSLEIELQNYKLNSDAVRQYYMKCINKGGTQVFPFSKYATTFEKDDFPITFTLHTEEDLKDSSVVMMPDLVFQLKSKATGADYGTLSMPFTQPPLKEEQQLAMSWSEISAKEYAWNEKNNKDYCNLPILKEAVIEETAYKCFIDVYACKDGYLMWDNDFKMGRNLRSRKLFTVFDKAEGFKEKQAADDDDDTDDEPPMVNQYFNPADWMVDKPDGLLDEAYSTKEIPCIACGEWISVKMEQPPAQEGEDDDGPPADFDPDNCKWESNRDKNHVPLTREKLWECYFKFYNDYKGQMHPFFNKFKRDVYILNHPIDLCRISTKLMADRMEVIGWRATSHLNAPSFSWDNVDYEPNNKHVRELMGTEDCDSELKDDDPTKNKDTIPGIQPAHLKECHTYTFMRKVGHVIDPTSRDSRILCRLRMGMPEDCLN